MLVSLTMFWDVKAQILCTTKGVGVDLKDEMLLSALLQDKLMDSRLLTSELCFPCERRQKWLFGAAQFAKNWMEGSVRAPRLRL